MPTTGVFKGQDIVIALYNETLSEYEIIGCAKECSLNFASEELDVSCKDSNWKQSITGMFSATLSASGFHIEGNPVTPFKLFGHLTSRTLLTFQFGLKEGVIQTGDKYYEGECYVSSLDNTAGLQTLDYAVNFLVTGEVLLKTAV